MGVGRISLKSDLRETKVARMVNLERAGLLCPTPVSVSGALLLVLVLDEHALNLAMPFCRGAGRGSSEKVLKLCCMAASPEIPGPKPGSLGN